MSLQLKFAMNGLRHVQLCRSYAEISKFIRSSNLPSYSRRSGYATSPNRLISQSPCFEFSSSARNASIISKPIPPEIVASYKSTFDFPSSSHEIVDLASASAGEEVIVHGYLGSRSDLSKNLSFVPLLSKELRHSIQIISTAKSADGESKPSHIQLKSLNYQTPVAVRGILKVKKVKEGVPEEVDKIKNFEIDLIDIQPLNEFPKDIIITEDTRFPPEQRHLQLRTDKNLRDALAFRAKTNDICRDELQSHGFLEIETPLLFKSTPEGAREFLVPTRNRGLSYALPQSPQQYKQVLMASGIPKYFQVARCFRDEDLRADRQPEFTQLDLEMSFAKGEDVMNCIENLLRRLWSELLQINDLPSPFPRMLYSEAMAHYGSDKPDLRLGMEIHRIEYLLPMDLIDKIGPLVDPIVEVMKLHVSDEADKTRKFITEFMDSPEATPFLANPEGQPGIFIYDSRKPLQGLQPFGFEAAERVEEELELDDGDLVVLQARKNAPFSGGSTPMGNLRLAIHKAAVTKGLIDPPKGFEFLWITGFPLFSPTNDVDPGQGGTAGLSSTHHPFTAPKTAEDFDLLFTAPERVQADHYDIVVNGVELGGGSRRIHDARVQEFILRDVLKMHEERLQDFEHLLDVLRAGCPPHAGIALGFDRLITVMLSRDSVRDVIAFPKSGKGEDLLVKSPTTITKTQLETYHLQLSEEQ